ncbi:glutamate-1-semialdehyde 2,1-aminomutase [Mumia sp. zg.B21]|uniref:glutamate-1-semialdehyde 2,1-aminomutase n=1 Tax=Mumia sp. zg.B21 TaxID=2855447 RepID=UPI001C6EB090|nr:glutamate-1-semialdehyde 2,1-aminomutase [Mumia sp. zg.B21]MBW9210772.1 glutamate-1-semialdehyde 2,1-aminomutase [Mumia sp. zg.B21]
MPKAHTSSRAAAERLQTLVPGGAHTYAKGPDQYPADLAPVIARGRGSHVWDVDGREFIEYGSGLRSVALGHAHPEVVADVRACLEDGSNFARPSVHELDAAEDFLSTVPTVDMVKFAKNGSDATTAAVKLARAVTGRDEVAICVDHPFFSCDDWFIGATPLGAGIPKTVQSLTVRFPFGDLDAARALLEERAGKIACLVLEPETAQATPEGYLAALHQLAHEHGALVVLDETITGFRRSERGVQGLVGVRPDLTVFGKAMGNGFAVSALAGRREVMERGGLATSDPRVFLLSTTHGGETHALAAARAVMRICRRDGVAARLDAVGRRLRTLVEEVTASEGVADRVVVRGRPCNLVFATLDPSGAPSQEYRTLFMRELLLNGVLAPSFVVSAALTDEDLERTAAAVGAACRTYRKALDSGDPLTWAGGRAVKPVFRTFA